METKSRQSLKMIAHEAFIKRAAEIYLPFMLKGSYVTRQYFPKNINRIPADLDWVYLKDLTNEVTAQEKFTEWVTLITELDLQDEVKFISFKENAFWRMIDYAMADDFPTVNTDLICWIQGVEIEFNLDISFNLEVEQAPVPLLYNPIEGEPFVIPYTVPISLQVAWKIHQTLVRPRFKDLFDLTYLVQHSDFDLENLQFTMQALVNECYVDNIDLNKLNYFLSYDFNSLFPLDLIEGNWNLWRHNVQISHVKRISSWDERASFLTDLENLPTELENFLNELSISLNSAGLNIELMNRLPSPKLIRRRTYKDLANSSLSLTLSNELKPIDIEKLKIELERLKNQPIEREIIATPTEVANNDYKEKSNELGSGYDRPKGFFALIKEFFRT